jgi:3-oxoacyl-[acyl-carrier protein] reductase
LTIPHSIGAACAKALYLQGVNLALTYASNEDKIRALLKELTSLSPEGNHPTATLHRVDVGSADEIEELFNAIARAHGQHGPDILVSNAGYGKRIPDIADISIDEFDYTLNVNLRASFILSKLSIPHMTAQGWGRIIFVSSLAAHGGGINGCHYAASKAGLHGLMKSLATKHAKDGITVNDVAPAMIGETGLIPDEKTVEGTAGDVRNIPVGRLGTPKEVANVVMMFCETGYLTGQSVLLSGGLK